MIEDNKPNASESSTQKPKTTTLDAGVPAFGLASATRLPLALPAKVAHHHRRFKEWFAALSTKQRGLFFTTVAVTTVAFVGAGFMLFGGSPEPQTSAPKSKKTPVAAAPTTVPSLLTGLRVDPSVNERVVTGVMIENSVAARPQSGLDQAGVVFEAIAEGGITRFLALYQDSQPSYLGPIRSARPYYVQWCQGFDCAYAHVGGSPEALQNIKDWGIKDLNQFAGAQHFQRVNNRAAPHNVYSSISQLNNFATERGYTTSKYTGFARLDKEGKRDPAQTVANGINMDYPGALYDVRYDYDAASNSYKRSLAGAIHNSVDASGTAQQIAPKVVIGMAISQSNNGKYTVYQVVGGGEVVIFQNGTVIRGTWSKPSPTAQIVFLDSNGAPIKLNPGQTWISALGAIGHATYN